MLPVLRGRLQMSLVRSSVGQSTTVGKIPSGGRRQPLFMVRLSSGVGGHIVAWTRPQLQYSVHHLSPTDGFSKTYVINAPRMTCISAARSSFFNITAPHPALYRFDIVVFLGRDKWLEHTCCDALKATPRQSCVGPRFVCCT